MRSPFFIILFAAVLYSCGGKDEKPDTEKKVTETSVITKESEPSGVDADLTNWLKGKMLKSDDATKDYNDFKLYADGTCADKGNAKAEWEIKNGELVIHSAMDLKFKIDKKDENTLILHRSLSDETYKVEPIQ